MSKPHLYRKMWRLNVIKRGKEYHVNHLTIYVIIVNTKLISVNGFVKNKECYRSQLWLILLGFAASIIEGVSHGVTIAGCQVYVLISLQLYHAPVKGEVYKWLDFRYLGEKKMKGLWYSGGVLFRELVFHNGLISSQQAVTLPSVCLHRAMLLMPNQAFSVTTRTAGPFL